MTVWDKWWRIGSLAWLRRGFSAFRLTHEDVERHSRAVGRMRVILPVLGGIIILGCFSSVRVPKVDFAFAREFGQVGLVSDDLHMVSPTFLGEDGEGTPFTLAAQAATQHQDDPDMISLESPMGYSEEGAEGAIQLVAPLGLFQRSTNTLRLSDGVEVERRIAQGNYLITTAEAKFNLVEQTLSSDVGIKGVGDRGSVAAERMETLSDGTIVLEGNVRMRLMPKLGASVPQRNQLPLDRCEVSRDTPDAPDLESCDIPPEKHDPMRG